MTVCEVIRDSILPSAIGIGIGAGLGASAAAVGAWKTYSVATAALFGGLTTACALAVAVLASELLRSALECLVTRDFRYITRMVLICLAAAALTAGVATLAGFTVTLLDVALFALIPQLAAIGFGCLDRAIQWCAQTNVQAGVLR